MSWIDELATKLSDKKEKKEDVITERIKPKDGENLWRLLPSNDGEHPIRALPVHFNIHPEGKPVICLRHVNKRCPACEAGTHFWQKDGATKDDKELAKKLFKTKNPRCFTLAMDRVREDVPPRWWDFTDKIGNRLISLLQKKGDFFDLKKGRDIEMEYSKGDRRNNIFPSTTVDLGDKGPLFEDSRNFDEYLAQAPDFHDVFPIYSAAEIEEMVRSFVTNGQASNPETLSKEVDYKSPSKPKADTETSKIDAAFAEFEAG